MAATVMFQRHSAQFVVMAAGPASRSTFCSPMNLMTFSKLSIQDVSFPSKKAHSSFSNFRRKDDFTSTLLFSWSIRPSMIPSEMARTTHGSTTSSLSSRPLATSARVISERLCAKVANVKSLIFDMASSTLRSYCVKSASFFFWKSRRLFTVPLRKTSQSLTSPLSLPLLNSLTVSKLRMSSNWMTLGMEMASVKSWTVHSVTILSDSSDALAPWKSWWYLFK
mmetsp:Transcript_71256/g.204426  ORF Transcript_71256/g.204426 Transcript_71256/m.204426 type:complete len:223 (+) Transcript_71256:113-781(+)